jgi:sec-independent protein translocase protein TatA
MNFPGLHALAFGPGLPELLVILLIVLLIFGAGKLPAIGDALGRTIKNFRRSAAGNDEIEVSKQKELAERKRAELGRQRDDDSGDDEDVEEAEVVAEKARKAD